MVVGAFTMLEEGQLVGFGRRDGGLEATIYISLLVCAADALGHCWLSGSLTVARTLEQKMVA
jgi:hypothetical protein